MSKDEIATLPSDDAAEAAVLAAVLVDNRLFSELAQIITLADIYRPSHRMIWEVMSQMAARNEAIDVITLSDRLHQRGWLEPIGGPGALHRLQGESWTTNAPWYARLVREKARYRALYALASRVADEARTEARPLEELAATIHKALGTVQGVSGATKSGGELARGLQEWIRDSIQNETAGGVSTGIRDLDELLGGGVRGERLYLVGGITKMGKTTLIIGVTANLLFNEGYAVDFISCEMSPVDIAAKYAGWLAQVDVDTWIARQREHVRRQARGQRVEMSQADIAASGAVADAMEAIRLAPLNVALIGRPVAREIALMARARQMEIAARGGDPKKYALVVDYLQACHNGNDRQNDSERISEVSQTLNAISKDLKIPVFVIFQFDKKADDDFTQYGVAPSYARLKGSSQPAQDANHFLVAHRAARDSQNERDHAYMCVTQELSRHGRQNQQAHLKADLPQCRFTAWQGEPPAAAARRGQGGRRDER